MTIADDKRFWDRSAKKYSKGEVSDQAGYQRTLDRTKSFLRSDARVLELGCGTGTTALFLADNVQSYLGTDISSEMIRIATEKSISNSTNPSCSFRVATAETLANEAVQFTAILGFNYLHLVRDLPGTLHSIHALLEDGGLFITKTPCVSEMNPLIRLVLLPAMRIVGLAPYAGSFRAGELSQQICAAGFDILATESHATKGDDSRPFIVARKN